MNRTNNNFPPIRPTPPTNRNTHHKSWISDFTWRLIDQRSTLRRQPNHDPNQFTIQSLHQQIQKSLCCDWKHRTKIEQLLDDQDLRGAWGILRKWYRQANHQVT
jgi:hypothetical protein